MSDPTPAERARALYKTTTCAYECACHMVIFPHEGEVATAIRDAVLAERAQLAGCYVALARAAADAGMEHSAVEFAARAFCAPGDERPATVILREAGDRLTATLAQFNDTDPLARAIRVAFATEDELARLAALPPPEPDAAADAVARAVFEATHPLREAALAHVFHGAPPPSPEVRAATVWHQISRHDSATAVVWIAGAIRRATQVQRDQDAQIAQAAADKYDAELKELAALPSWHEHRQGSDEMVGRQIEAQEIADAIRKQVVL